MRTTLSAASIGRAVLACGRCGPRFCLDGHKWDGQAAMLSRGGYTTCRAIMDTTCVALPLSTQTGDGSHDVCMCGGCGAADLHGSLVAYWSNASSQCTTPSPRPVMLAMCGRKVERITLCIYTDLYTTGIGGRRRTASRSPIPAAPGVTTDVGSWETGRRETREPRRRSSERRTTAAIAYGHDHARGATTTRREHAADPLC